MEREQELEKAIVELTFEIIRLKKELEAAKNQADVFYRYYIKTKEEKADVHTDEAGGNQES